MAFGRKRKEFQDVAVLSNDPLASIKAMEQAQREESAEDARIRSDITKMIDQGMGTVTDLWAPPRMRILDDYIEMGDECLAIFTVSNWPQSLQYGWLSALVNDSALSDIKMDVSLHIHPVKKQYALAYMKDRYISARSSYDTAAEKGKLRASNEKAYIEQMSTARSLQELLQSDSENLFQVSLVIGIYGENQWKRGEGGADEIRVPAHEDVKNKTRRVRRSLSANSAGGFEIKPLLHQQREGIKSLLPWGYGGLHAFQNFYTSALATCYPFTQGKLQVEDGIVYGINPANSRPVIFDNFSSKWCESYSCIVLGTTGSGKSSTVKTLLGRYAVRGTQIFIIDPAASQQGEYVNFVNSLGGSLINFGGGAKTYFNPFEMRPPESWRPGMPTDQNEARALYQDKKSYLHSMIQLMLSIYQNENPQAVLNSALSEFTTVIDMLIDRFYELYGINVSTRFDYGQWGGPTNKQTGQRTAPSITMFYHLVNHYCYTITRDMLKYEQIESWGNINIDKTTNTLRSSNKIENRMTHGYYHYVVDLHEPLWTKRHHESLEVLDKIIREYVTNPRTKQVSAKGSLFNGTAPVDISNQCIVFQLGQVAENLKELATFLTFELIYSRLTAQGEGGRFSQKILCLDEAWKILRSPYSRNYVSQVSREGRKLRAGLWLISQKYADFAGENEDLWEQAQVKLVFGLPSSDARKVQVALDLSPSMTAYIDQDSNRMGPGYGLLSVRGKTTCMFYCEQTPLEQRVADTTDSNRPPLTLAEIIGFERADALGMLTEDEKRSRRTATERARGKLDSDLSRVR